MGSSDTARIRGRYVFLPMVVASLLAGPAAAGIEALAFLEGRWRGKTWQTRYSSPEGGMILSASKEYGPDGRVAFFEYERIVEEGGEVFLVPSPFGKESVRFRMTSLDPAARRAVFENPAHDFPRRIEYHRPAPDRLVFHLAGVRGGKDVASTTELRREDERTPTMAAADAPLPDLRTLWDFQNPAASETRFRELAATLDATTRPGDRAEVLTQQARAQGLQRNFDQAHATLDEAEALIPEGDRSVARVRLLLERGRVFNSSGKKKEAHPLFREGMELAHEIGRDGLAVDGAHMLAIVAEGPAKQAKWNRHALWMIDHSDQEAAKKWLGSVMNNLGWSLHDAGEFAEALEIFERAWAWRKEQDPAAESTRIARWAVARGLRSLGRLDEALAHQEALLAEFAALGREDGYVLEELGELHHARGDASTAGTFFAKAHAVLSRDAWFVEAEATRLARMAELGGVTAP